jgi:hypothetical protein
MENCRGGRDTGECFGVFALELKPLAGGMEARWANAAKPRRGLHDIRQGFSPTDKGDDVGWHKAGLQPDGRGMIRIVVPRG